MLSPIRPVTSDSVRRARSSPTALPAPPTAARCPAPRVRPAGARRAALHHDPPGLRAVVPAAAARGRDGPRRSSCRPPPRAVTATSGSLGTCQPGARDRTGAGPADRRARDDDAPGLPRVPAAAGPGERVPVGPVPRAGIPLGREGSRVRWPVQEASPRRRSSVSPRRLAEPTLWDGFVHVLGEAGLDTSSDEEAITASLRTVAHDRSFVRRRLGACRGAAAARRAGLGLAGPARRHGRADDQRQVRHRRQLGGRRTCAAGSTCSYYPLLWELRSAL